MKGEKEGCPVRPTYAGQENRPRRWTSCIGIKLKQGLQQVQGPIPMVLMATVVQELELSNVEGQVDFGHPAIRAHHLTQPGPGTLHAIAVNF